MGLHYDILIKTAGVVTALIGASMLFAALVSLIYEESAAFEVFICCAIPMIAAGVLVDRLFAKETGSYHARDAMLSVTAAWFLASLLGSLPFLFLGAVPDLASAFFEASSGFTTTGASVISDVESLSKGLLFWRSFTHWLGGAGIVVFAVAVLPALGSSGFMMVRAEASSAFTEKLLPKTGDASRRLFLIYCLLSLVLLIFLLAGDMSLFDALIHTFGTVATGGFSNYNNGVAHFDSSYINWVISAFMILSSINFTLYYWLVSRHWRDFFRDEELRWFLCILGVMSLLSAIALHAENVFRAPLKCLEMAVFQCSSIMSTTGFGNGDYNVWPTLAKTALLLLMFCGGCASSTSGGIKVVRVAVIVKLILRNIERRVHPSAIISIKLDGRTVPIDMISAAAAFIFLYFVVFFGGTLVLSLQNTDMLSAMSACIACLSNVGPGFGAVGPVETYSAFAAPLKIFMGVLMIAGRLEVIALALLFTPRFWSNN